MSSKSSTNKSSNGDAAKVKTAIKKIKKNTKPKHSTLVTQSKGKIKSSKTNLATSADNFNFTAFTDVFKIVTLLTGFFLFVANSIVLLDEIGLWSGKSVLFLGKVGLWIGSVANTWFGIGGIFGSAYLISSITQNWNSSHWLVKWSLLKVAVVTILASIVGWIWKGKVLGGLVGQMVALPITALFGTLGTILSSLAILLLLAPKTPILVVLSDTVRWFGSSIKFALIKPFSLVFRLGNSAFNFLLNSRRKLNQTENKENLRNASFNQNSKRVTLNPKTDPLPKLLGLDDLPKLEESPKVIVVPPPQTTKTSWDDFLGKFKNYSPPPFTLLKSTKKTKDLNSIEDYEHLAKVITQKLLDFQIAGQVTHIHPGPVITLFEFEPVAGVKVGKIAALADDLAMSLKASSLRILAPIPGQGTVGIEVPNKTRHIVRLRDVVESEQFLTGDSSLTVPLGTDTNGHPVVADIAKMPHLLIAGATGTGKSVCINSLLLGLLFRASPSEVGLILIDPKILELSIYADIPHLRVPVVTVAKQAKAVLLWAVQEMERRYRLMQQYSVRGIDAYNEQVSNGTLKNKTKDATSKEEALPMQKVVIVIDELADLMLQVGREIEELITRLAQKARAAGIHLILATQRPSVDVITGLIKANFPARLSFRVTSRIDSRTILDQIGAERLLGKGDMLFMIPGAHSVKRIHGAFVTDEEVAEVVDHIKAFSGPAYDQEILSMLEKALEDEGNEKISIDVDEYDTLYDQAVRFATERGQISTSLIQRYFRIGYNRAARLIDLMEREGIVGPMDGSKPREVLLRIEGESNV